MNFKIAGLVVALGVIVMAASFGFAARPQAVAAEEHTLPGMCNGRKDADTSINAQANGKGSEKYVLNVRADAAGEPTGILIVGRGRDRIQVTDWCRIWQHIPGSSPGEHCEADGAPEGAITAHAVGLATVDGHEVVIRTDVRETDEGRFFRVRYKPSGEHDESDHTGEEGGCEDEGWTRIPVEGWAPLAQLRVR